MTQHPAARRDTDKTASTAAHAAQPLPISGYPQRSAAGIIEVLPRLTPQQRDRIEEYELAHAARVTVLNKIHTLRHTP